MNPFVLLSFCGKNRPNGTAACPLFQTLLELHLLVEFTNDKIDNVGFFIDGECIGKDKKYPYEQFWNISYWADGNKHTILATAEDKSGNENSSELIEVTIPKYAMIVPDLISPPNDTIFDYNSEVNLIWNYVSDAIIYNIQVSSLYDFSSTDIDTVISDTTMIISLNTGEYFWRLRAQNNLNKFTEWSSIKRFTIEDYYVIKTYGGSGGDMGRAICHTSDGGYMIVGCTNSFGLGSSDIWLVKTDENGEMEWNKTYGGSGSECGYSISQTSDGGFFIVGNTSSYGSGSSDIWLVKTDNNGIQEWDKTFGDTNYDCGYSGRQSFDEGFIVTGYITSNDGNRKNVYLVKTDKYGNKEWENSFDESIDDCGNSLIQKPDGSFFILGYTLTGKYSSNDTDILLIKTDSNGNKQWLKIYGGTGSEKGSSIFSSSDGGFVLTGYTNSYGGSYFSAWLVKLDNLGNEVWDKTFGSSSYDYGTCVIQNSIGEYTFTGYTESTGKGVADIWLVNTSNDGYENWNRIFRGLDDDYGYCVIESNNGKYVVTGSCKSFGSGNSDLFLIIY